MLALKEDVKQEIQFWITSLNKYSGQPIWRSPSAVRAVYSDASDTGFGGYVVEHGGQVAQGLWSKQESRKSSTYREIKAVTLVLDALSPENWSAK